MVIYEVVICRSDEIEGPYAAALRIYRDLEMTEMEKVQPLRFEWKGLRHEAVGIAEKESQVLELFELNGLRIAASVLAVALARAEAKRRFLVVVWQQRRS